MPSHKRLVVFGAVASIVLIYAWSRRVSLTNQTVQPVIVELKAHSSGVSALAFSPDSKFLASGDIGLFGDTSNRVIIWDIATAKPKFQISAQMEVVSSLSFSPNGRLLAGGSNDLRLWSVQSGKLLKRWPVSAYDVAFSPDGKELATAGGDGTLRIWDVASRKLKRHVALEKTIANEIAFSPDGKMLAVACDNQTIRVWHIRMNRTFRVYYGVTYITDLIFSPDSKSIKFVDQNNILRHLRLSKHQVQVIKKSSSPLTNASFSRDGKHYAISTWRSTWSDSHVGEIEVAEASTGKVLHVVSKNIQPMESLALSADGKMVASGGSAGFNSIQLLHLQ